MEPTVPLSASANDPDLHAEKAVAINRWGNAVWLTGGGLGVTGFGLLTLLTVAGPGGLIVGSFVTATGILFLVFAGYELRALRRAERVMRARGEAWRAPRTLVPVARRNLHLPLPPGEALQVALETLQSSGPELGIRRTRWNRDSVRAYVPTPILVTIDLTYDPWYPPNTYLPYWWPGAWQVVRITAEERAGGTDLRVRVHPLTQQLGENLADLVVEAIGRRVPGSHPPVSPGGPSGLATPGPRILPPNA
jgi:hypothetical protein